MVPLTLSFGEKTCYTSFEILTPSLTIPYVQKISFSAEPHTPKLRIQTQPLKKPLKKLLKIRKVMMAFI